MEELMLDFLNKSYPIIRMRTPTKFNGLKTNGNFKRIIKINEQSYFKISNDTERYLAVEALSRIMTRIFDIDYDESISAIKKHLHIK